jgi:hypothetical protein
MVIDMQQRLYGQTWLYFYLDFLVLALSSLRWKFCRCGLWTQRGGNGSMAIISLQLCESMGRIYNIRLCTLVEQREM